MAKSVFITGASRGIGAGIAALLAKQGYKIIGTSTTEAGANVITKALSSYNFENKGVILDLSAQTTVEESIANIVKEHGPFDIVINNAAITDDQLFMRMKKQQWQQVMDVNLNASFDLIKACLRPMVKARWGRIVNISSVVGLTGNLGQANYAATKAAMIAFTKSVAQEVARYGVTLNCIAPGFIATEMTDKLRDDIKQTITKQIPMGRIGEVGDIAECVSYLISDAAKYITGSTIHVNGGLYMN